MEPSVTFNVETEGITIQSVVAGKVKGMYLSDEDLIKLLNIFTAERSFNHKDSEDNRIKQLQTNAKIDQELGKLRDRLKKIMGAILNNPAMLKMAGMILCAMENELSKPTEPSNEKEDS